MKRAWVFILFMAANVQAQIHEAATPFSGMANAGGAFFSPWCVYTNQAGIARLEENYAGISYRHIFDLKELSTKTAFVVHPFTWGTAGITYTHFGYEKYSEQMAGIAWGKQLADFLDIGVKVDYLFSKVAEQAGIRQTVFFETGLIFTLPYEIRIGLHAYNPADIARLAGSSSLYTAEKYTAGVSWKIDRMFTLTGQVEILDADVLFAAGVLFLYEGFLRLRCGFRTEYNNIYAGAGIKWNRYEFDLNYNTHPHLGNMLSICLGVCF